MKKKSLYLLMGTLLAGVLLAAGILVWRGVRSAGLAANQTGVSWYDPNETSFTITTEQELYDLAKVSEYYSFEGQTIKLGADIVVNEGDAEEWGEKPPEKKWYPITGFAGTFDGQGHTISGLYGFGYYYSMGLFTDTQKTSKIQNLKLVNSFFSGVGSQGIGSIAGSGGGTFDTIYSDAVIHGDTSNYGGIVGVFNVRGNNVINNCWYDGSMILSGSASQAGGMVGYVQCLGSSNAIKHSLNSADIVGVNTKIGGICGGVADGSSIEIQDSLNSGNMDCAENNAGIGSLIGQMGGSSSSAKFIEAYTVSESYGNTVGTFSGTVTGNAKRVESKKMIGYRAYQWTNLDYQKYWTVVLESTPILQAFADEVLDVSKVNKIIDTSWYTEDGYIYTIKTVGQLYGFADLLGETDFQGKIIRLGADIVVNEGDAKKWAKEAPEYQWFPLGKSGLNRTYKPFAGTFDGNGYTISGLYTTQSKNSVGFFGELRGTVKNLKLENSYFEYTGTDKFSYVGSIAGLNYGKVDTVKSSAIVVNCGRATGGLVGYTGDNSANLITNCWFDGTVIVNSTKASYYGGILGLLNGGAATVEHCLNTGTIVSQANFAGGLVGAVQSGGVLTMTDSLNAGTNDNEAKSRYIGATFGWLDLGTKDDGTRSGAIHMKDVYGIKEFSTSLYGAKNPDAAEPYGILMRAENITGNKGYQYTTLDFTNYWAVDKGGTPILKSFAKTVPNVSGLARMLDFSWYTTDKKDFTIKTVAQLYGFSVLAETYDFEGQTVRLGADIDVNPNWEAGAKAPANTWTPIGKSGLNKTVKPFAGTFEGNGHKIRGIYVKSEETNIGFFGETTGTVGSFILENSYIEYNGESKFSYVGSVAGINYGKIEGVKSNAIVVNSRSATGGLVGYTGDKTTNTITNCWFDGTVIANSSKASYYGGILGFLNGGAATIEHCLNTGTIVSQADFGGGLVGAVQSGGVLTMNDCLNAGTNDNQAKVKHIGATFGWFDLGTKEDGTRSGAIHMRDVYGITEFSSNLYGSMNSKATAPHGTVVNQDEITGYNGYKWTTLDFNEYWAVNESGTPILKKFTDFVPSIAGVNRMLDLDWYSVDKKEFTIKTVAELYGFANLSATYDFEGQTIRLGATIDVNPGWSAGEQAPEYTWKPIGKSGMNKTAKAFAGTFAGDRYAIRGIYVKSDQTSLGFFGAVAGTVGDFVLENSYIEYNNQEAKGNAYSYVGSVAGINYGDIHDIKSSAIIVNNRRGTGGIAGYTDGTTTNTIRNCWFDGKILSTDANARVAGGIIGVQNGGKSKIQHCLNTGTITVSAQLAGGLAGAVQAKGILTIEDSINAGICDGSGRFPGAIIGYFENGPKDGDKTLDSVIMTSVYGIQEFSANLYGTKEEDACEPNGHVVSKTTIQGYDGYKWTSLDFENYWSVDLDGTPVLTYFVSESPSVEKIIRPDTSWYDKDAEKLYISTPEEFYGFAYLSQTEDFEGQKIILKNDIDMNPGWTASATQPDNPWTPIGKWGGNSSAKTFAGTFDGQNHTVSGLYVSADSQFLGMFGRIDNATIKNLKLMNSYIANTANGANADTYVGSIAGLFGGTISGVQSDAIVVNACRTTGGLVGSVQTQTSISNSEFKGSLYGADSMGGLVGWINATTLTINHCLNSGQIYVEAMHDTTDQAHEVGGLVGTAMTATLTITDSLNVGKIELASGIPASYAGNLVGRVNWKSTATLNSVYGKKESNDDVDVRYTYKDNVTRINCELLTDITGNNSYLNSGLDFYIPEIHKDGYWVILDNQSTPVLKKFANATTYVDVRTIEGIRTSWYQDTLYTVNDLFGLAKASESADFSGRTVKLGADITINTGDVKDAAVRANWKKWTPIGVWDGNPGAKKFAGTFDGQKHTISGLYVSEAGKFLGLFGRIDNATIQNLKLANSYVENTATGAKADTYVGSIAGLFGGTI